MHNFDHKFLLSSGTVVYVQDDVSRTEGYRLCEWVDDRWRAPKHFFHFRPGGHVAAARKHQADAYVMGLDLRRFFDQVSRSKVHRALRRIGYANADAYDFACASTVVKDGRPGAFSLPFGFVQSMHLASLALHFSALGREMIAVRRDGVQLTTYVDDVLLSANDPDTLIGARDRLFASAEVAGYSFNADKERGPAEHIEAFNILIGGGGLRIAEHRMIDFRRTVREPEEARALATIGYVGTVNADQAIELAAVRTAAGF